MTGPSIGPTNRSSRRFLSKRNQIHGVISAPLHQQRRQRTSNNECPLAASRRPGPRSNTELFRCGDASGQQIWYYESEPGRQSAAKLLTRDEPHYCGVYLKDTGNQRRGCRVETPCETDIWCRRSCSGGVVWNFAKPCLWQCPLVRGN